MTCGFLIQLVFYKKNMWFIGVEVEQETSTLPLKKNPGSAPVLGTMVSTINFSNVIFDVFSLFSFGKFSRMVTLLKLSPLLPYLPKWKEKRNEIQKKKKTMGKQNGKLVSFSRSLKSFDISRHNLVHEGKGYSVMRFLQRKGLASSTWNASKFLPVIE